MTPGTETRRRLLPALPLLALLLVSAPGCGSGQADNGTEAESSEVPINVRTLVVQPASAIRRVIARVHIAATLRRPARHRHAVAIRHRHAARHFRLVKVRTCHRNHAVVVEPRLWHKRLCRAG